jgi:hypothetical protein
VNEYQSIPIPQKHVKSLGGMVSGSQRDDSMIKAMDDMNSLMMFLNGTSPEARVAELRKEEEEKQLKDREFSQNKVLEWMK